MARASHRETYVSHLLEICKTITEQIYSEIDEVHHDRGRCSSDVKEALIHVIEDKFEHIHYKRESKDDDRNCTNCKYKDVLPSSETWQKNCYGCGGGNWTPVNTREYEG